jgi:transmembrane sensor
VNRQIYQEASGWLVELRAGDVDLTGRAKFDAWLRASPEHVRAFLEASSIWEEAGDPDLDRGHGAEELIALARGHVATNVVPLPSAAPAGRETATTDLGANPHAHREAVVAVPARVRRRRVLGALAASIVVVAGGLIWMALYTLYSPSYSTGTGEERMVRLSDGSTMELNSRSKVRVRFSKAERDIDLVRGQVLFHVAKEPPRPFVVRSDATRVRAVGTQFDVYRQTSGTTVTVLEGTVAVLPVLTEISHELGTTPAAGGTAELARTPSIATILVSAGEQVTVTPSAVTKPTHADVAAATAWTQRELIFDRTSLQEVAQEFNRYNVKPLVVSDGNLKDFHVTGVFSSTDPASLLRFLRAQPGITVEETEDQIRISKQ